MVEVPDLEVDHPPHQNAGFAVVSRHHEQFFLGERHEILLVYYFLIGPLISCPSILWIYLEGNHGHIASSQFFVLLNLLKLSPTSRYFIMIPMRFSPKFIKFLLPSCTTFLLGFVYLLGYFWLPFVFLGAFCILVERLPDVGDGPLSDVGKWSRVPLVLNILALGFHLVLAFWVLGEAEATLFEMVGLIMSLATIISSIGGVTAHELIHYSNPLAKRVGNILCGLSFDLFFMPVGHTRLHHSFVGTLKDPATPLRGEGFWRFAFRCHSIGFKACWSMERQRLTSKPFLKQLFYNRILMTTGVFVGFCSLFLLLAGIKGIVVYLMAALLARLLHDVVNYIQHYGLIRVPGTKVRLDHSWDYKSRIISGYTLNLNRQSHHHMESSLPYWALTDENPRGVITLGFITSFFLSVVPFLWPIIMTRFIQQWDEQYATVDELALRSLHTVNSFSVSHLGFLKKRRDS